MNIILEGDVKILEAPDTMIIRNAQDALESLMNGNYLGTRKILLHEKNLPSDFFDLKTGMAGEILQKFSTYDGYVAIVGDYTKYTSKSLKDFICESNTLGRVNFVRTKAEAIAVLKQKVEKS
jgi:hypothetical protein